MYKFKKAKRVTSVALLSLLLSVFVLSSSVLVYAENTNINEIGETTTTETTVVEQQSNISNSQSSNQASATTSNTNTPATTNNGNTGSNQVAKNADKNESTAKAVGDLFSSAGVNEESAAKAKKWIEPVAKVLNTVIAVILGLFASMLILVSVLDMVYLGIPITRQWLCPGGADMGAAAAGGMGAMGMQGAMPPATGKNVMFAYLKKRAFSLVMLGVCLVLFSCTVFTDLGITVGTKIIGLLTGIGM